MTEARLRAQTAGFRSQGILQQATRRDRRRSAVTECVRGTEDGSGHGSACRDGTVPNLACGGRPDLTGHRRACSLHRKLYLNRNPSLLSQPSCQPQHDLHSSCNTVFRHGIAVRERASEGGAENVQFKY